MPFLERWAHMLLDHLLRLLSLPIPQSKMIASVGLILLIFRRYRIGLLIVATGGTWLYLCATPGFAAFMRSGLESQYPSLPTMSYPVVDAIVVLGGDGIPLADDDWRDNSALGRNRLGYGFQLYQSKRAPIMVLSAAKGGALKMAKILENEGLSSTALRIESHAHNTRENALYTSQILKQENLQRILLVTSPFHMPRSLAAFRKQGIDAIPAPSMSAPVARTAAVAWWPQHSALLLSQLYLHEYIGLCIYKLRGWA